MNKVALCMPAETINETDRDATKLLCPVCGSKAMFIGWLEADYIISQLECYYNEKLSDRLGIIDYKMYRCEKCTLEWADPLLAGGDLFYKWIITHADYYPKQRWEWIAVIERMKNICSDRTIDVLEIGCGSGEFLEMARDIPNVRAVGLDTAQDSVDKCCSKGLEVYCETIESFLSRPDKRRFDRIVAFHCLEHVCDPKELVASMSSLLKPTGSIFLSTPYSPMSFESKWFDPLNHPPHHLTRWNAASYNELAQQLGMQIKLFMPPSNNPIAGAIEDIIPLNRTFNSLNLAWHGTINLLSRRKMILAALKRPLATCKELLYQRKREKINHRTASDLVLVELMPDKK